GVTPRPSMRTPFGVLKSAMAYWKSAPVGSFSKIEGRAAPMLRSPTITARPLSCIPAANNSLVDPEPKSIRIATGPVYAFFCGKADEFLTAGGKLILPQPSLPLFQNPGQSRRHRAQPARVTAYVDDDSRRSAHLFNRRAQLFHLAHHPDIEANVADPAS